MTNLSITIICVVLIYILIIHLGDDSTSVKSISDFVSIGVLAYIGAKHLVKISEDE